VKLFEYFKASFSRKMARRFFKKYGYRIDLFDLGKEGVVEFANWRNPLIEPYALTKREIDFFKELIPSGSFAIDIGAHIGSLTVPMGLAAGHEGLVLALEPNPQVYEGLLLNSTLNAGKYNIIPLSCGAADTEGEFYYASSEASMSNGGLVFGEADNTLGKHKLKETVKTIRLSKYLIEHFQERLQKLSFIKIDAEGFDLMILKDLTSILKQCYPVVIVEVFFSKNRSLSEEECYEIFTILNTLGYNLYNVENFEVSAAVEELKKVPLIYKEAMPMGYTYNILAIPPGD
jgi:FkbM family methyltransferase